MCIEQIIDIKCKFKCNLVYGNYTIDLSSMSIGDEVDIKMHDALIFKVRPDDKLNGGVVGLEQILTVEGVGEKSLELVSYK